MVFNPIKEAEKQARKAVSEIIDPAVRKVRETKDYLVNKAQEEMKGKNDYWIGNARHWIETYADRAKDAAKGEIDDALSEARKEVMELKEDLPECVEDVMRDMAEKASEHSIKQALDIAIRVVEITQPTRYWLVFGIELALVVQGEVTVQVVIPNPISKLSKIKAWAANPPKGRAKIIECIGDFAPESLSGEFKISGNGGGAEWDTGQKMEQADQFLEVLGVS